MRKWSGSKKTVGALVSWVLPWLVAMSPAVAWGAQTWADQVVERTLDNGFKLILLPDHKAPVAVVQVWYRVGSRNETTGQTGLSHMLEHMMFKGTERRAPGEYSRIISRNGGSENAFTSDDVTVYFAKIASDRIPVVMELEGERMRGLVLDEKQFEPERQVVMEERRMRTEDDPVAFLFESLRAAAFLEHPYRNPIIGWPTDIQGWRLEDLRAHYDRYYQPNNAFLVAVGDFDPDAMVALAKRHFGRHPKGPEAPRVRAAGQPPRGERRVNVERVAQLPFVAVSFRVPNLSSEDALALEVVEILLSSGKTSRLYRDLVFDKQIALGASAYYERTAIDDKLFTVTGQPRPGVTPEKLEAELLAHLERLATTPPSEEEMERARAKVEAAFVFSQDSVSHRARVLGTYEAAGGWRQVDDYLPGVSAVTAEDVSRVARKYFTPRGRTVGVLRPQSPASRPSEQ